jgi:hypothetical protein
VSWSADKREQKGKKENYEKSERSISRGNGLPKREMLRSDFA